MEDKKWILWKPILIICAIEFIIGFVMGIFNIENNKTIDFLGTILVLPLSVGMTKYYMDFYRKKKVDWRKMFDFYNKFISVVVTCLLVSAIVGIGIVFLIVPGIIFAMMFSMVYYLLADGEENIIETLKKSSNMMDGYKMDLFKLNLSFIGLTILSILTLGILFIWTVPYMLMAEVIFYEKIKNKKK